MTEEQWQKFKEEQISACFAAMEKYGQETVGDEALTCILDDTMNAVKVKFEENTLLDTLI